MTFVSLLNPTLVCRCIADEHRSLALGIQSMIFRVIGSIPGPIVMGALFDASCEFWQHQCGDKGNCWVYNNIDLSAWIIVLLGSFRILSVILAICVRIFFDVTLCNKAGRTESNDHVPLADSYTE